MTDEINITISRVEDLVSQYDNDAINHELLRFLLDKVKFVKKTKNIKIIIQDNSDSNIDTVTLIKSGLMRAYIYMVKEYKYNHLVQIWLFLIGLFFLLIASFIYNDSIWHELLIIVGWVPIWKLMDLELHEDFGGRRQKYLIKRLLKSEYILKK